MQFEDDWPGIFIRGDNAMHFAMQLEALLHGYTGENHNARAYASNLAKLLRSCQSREGMDKQLATLVAVT